MVTCAVKCCKNYSSKKSLKGKNISYHRFPKDPKIKEKWIQAVSRANWFPGVKETICSIHFTEECFDVSKKGRRRLFPHSVPTLYITEKSFLGPAPLVSTSPNIEDTPRKKILKINLQRSRELCAKRRLDLKRLRAKNKKLKEKVTTLHNLLDNLKNKSYISQEQATVLGALDVKPKEIVKRILLAKSKSRTRSQYSPALRTFALTLNYYSSKAYSYVRRSFNSCLPHPSTLTKWYRNINGKPGFTDEALVAIKSFVENTNYTILCNIVFDEMCIRQKIEWDGQKHVGYVDMGTSIETDCNSVAREALVFMAVAINSNWKVPIGYFLIDGITAEQKANLVRHGLRLLHDTGVVVCSITFDGAPCNIAMASLLGCNFDTNNFKTTFPHPCDQREIAVFIDPSHVIKLIRNALQALNKLIDEDGGIVSWQYLIDLNNLQTEEYFHLSNKLSSQHILFHNKIMRVKLATQLFSKSVSEALSFCNTELGMSAFRGVGPTVNFLKLINDVFDVLNSRNINQLGYKKPMNRYNIQMIRKLFQEAETYIKNLYIYDTKEPVLNSKRKTGFLGLLICMNSALYIYNIYVEEKALLLYVPLYKVSQDHLELFFFIMRAHGGSNNNPSAKQLCSIYKKNLVHMEVREGNKGNCIPLENITILNCSSAIERINLTSSVTVVKEDEDDDSISLPDYDFYLSDFGTQIMTYIAGFVAHSIVKKLKCDTCISALLSIENTNAHNFITFKNKGGLIYPSQDCITICHKTEIIIRRCIAVSDSDRLGSKHTKLFIVSKTLKELVGIDIFASINFHQYDSTVLFNHLVNLTHSVIEKYIDIRLHYLSKRNIKPNTQRQIYNKLTLFRGQ